MFFRVFMTEAYAPLSNIIKYYGKVENGKVVKYGAQIPFNFRLMVTNMQSKASDFVKPITDFINSMPKGRHIHANWLVCIITFLSKFLHHCDLNSFEIYFLSFIFQAWKSRSNSTSLPVWFKKSGYFQYIAKDITRHCDYIQRNSIDFFIASMMFHVCFSLYRVKKLE